MAYSTGTATGIADLLDKLVIFLNANGFTQDSFAVDGTGKRYHGHNAAGLYVNIRSYIGETPTNAFANRFGSTNFIAGSIVANVGTGYNGANPWYNQAGVPVGTSTRYGAAALQFPNAAIPAYHFFSHGTGASVVVVVEWQAGYYQFLIFGDMTKKGTWTGGHYFGGSCNGTFSIANGAWNGSTGLHHYNGPGLLAEYPSTAFTNEAFIKCAVDSEANDWRWMNTGQGARPTPSRIGLTNLFRYGLMLHASPNSYNDASVLHPVIVSVFRDTNNSHTGSARSVIGELPKLFYLDITNLIPGQQLAFGGTNYRVFPFAQKKNGTNGGTPDVTGTGGVTATAFSSGIFGFAVEE